MKLAFTTLDVFTQQRFGGNPLAVVMDADALSTAQMQTIAREFNLSETIFVRRPKDPAHTASVRIFFPTAEIPFAGHPTIGCAIHLASLGYKDGCSFETMVTLEEVAGLVPVTVTRIGPDMHATFTAPVVPFAVPRPVPAADLLARAAGISAADIGFGNHRSGVHEGGPQFFFIPVRSAEALGRVQPSEPFWTEMAAATGVNNAYFYCPGTAPADFRARMFWKGAGFPEDPATGSASALLASQLISAGALPDGTSRLTLEQGIEMGRPSLIRMEADVAGGKLAAVRISGSAVRVSEGVIDI